LLKVDGLVAAVKLSGAWPPPVAPEMVREPTLAATDGMFSQMPVKVSGVPDGHALDTVS
jgi:hypothetical protein